MFASFFYYKIYINIIDLVSACVCVCVLCVERERVLCALCPVCVGMCCVALTWFNPHHGLLDTNPSQSF